MQFGQTLDIGNTYLSYLLASKFTMISFEEINYQNICSPPGSYLPTWGILGPPYTSSYLVRNLLSDWVMGASTL